MALPGTQWHIHCTGFPAISMFSTGLLLWMFYITNSVAGSTVYQGYQFNFALLPWTDNTEKDTTAVFLYITHTREGMCNVTDVDGAVYYVHLRGRDSVTLLHLPTNRILTMSTDVEDKRAVGLICTTKVILTVMQRRLDGGAVDAFPVLPLTSLSSRYIIPSVPNNAFLGVMSVYNSTNVTVHLNSTCSYSLMGDYYKQGGKLNIALQQGEVLQIASNTTSTDNVCDLVGTVVESSHSVAVFSGAPLLCYPGNRCDGAMSQVPPMETWGKSFIVPMVPGIDQYSIRITAMYNGTKISIDTFTGVESIILNEAEVYDNYFNQTFAVYIRSSYPVLVLQIAGTTYYQVFAAIVRPTDAYGTEYVIPDIQGNSMAYKRQVTIITSSKCTPHINVNENWSHRSTGSQTFALASFYPVSGSLVIKSNSFCPFGVLVTGTASVEMYGYFSVPVSDVSVSLEHSVNLTCTQDNWIVTVDTQDIATVFPTSVKKNIFMSNAFCPGVLEGDVLIFNVSYKDCNTIVEDKNNTVTFNNYLIEYEIDALTNLVDGARWRYNLQCVLQKHETDVKGFIPVDKSKVTVQATSKIQSHEAAIKFFTNAAYTNEMKGSLVEVGLGSRVYVQVETSADADVKLLVDNCYIKSGNSTQVPVILNRCEANNSTHIIGHVNKVTRFYFDVFEVPHHHDNMYLTCDVSFCPLMDFSPECQSGCLNTKL
ncbi:uncharacterized protein [Haliotis asinina]|uniref:uncharacterized protein n=1 Tax=Haliotis asinina TaxID=109174 RepID=UPI003531CBAB